MARILIVEDETHIAEGLRFNLEAEGHEVAVATDGQGWFGTELVDGCYVVTYIAPTDHSFAGGQRFLNRSACVEQGQTSTLEPVTLAPTESL